MATSKTAAPFVGVDALKHPGDRRRNIPTAEYQSLMADEAREPLPVSHPRGTSNVDRLRAERQQRNTNLDPQLVWRGKDAQDWTDLVAAAREAADDGFDVLIARAFNCEAHAAEFEKLGRVPVLKARMNPDLHMAGELKNTGAGNLFVVFGEPAFARKLCSLAPSCS